ncbi:hypothetical protein N7534_003532, partial [Penicillium rubens]
CELPTCKWQESCAEAGRADFRTVAISRTCTSHDGDHEKATTSHWKQFLDETSEGKLWEGSNGESSGVQGSFYPPTATAQVGAPAHALTEIRSHSIPKLKFIDNFKAAKGAATPGEDGLRTLIWERLWKYLGNITTRIFPSSIELGNHAQRRRSARLVVLRKPLEPTRHYLKPLRSEDVRDEQPEQALLTLSTGRGKAEGHHTGGLRPEGAFHGVNKASLDIRLSPRVSHSEAGT